MFAIDDCWFPFGATLSGNVLLFSSKRPEAPLSSLVASLAASSVGVSAVMCTRPGASSWLAVRTSRSFDNPEELNAPESTFVAQLAF